MYRYFHENKSMLWLESDLQEWTLHKNPLQAHENMGPQTRQFV